LGKDLRAWLQDAQVAVEHFYPTLAYHLATQDSQETGQVLKVSYFYPTLAYHLATQDSQETGQVLKVSHFYPTLAYHLATQDSQETDQVLQVSHKHCNVLQVSHERRVKSVRS